MIITTSSENSVIERRIATRAGGLLESGHEVEIVVALRSTGGAARGDTSRGLSIEGVPVHEIELPDSRRLQPVVFDTAMRATILREIRRIGIVRPDLMLVSSVDDTLVAARHLSVANDVPFVLLADEGSASNRSAQKRYGDILSQSVHEAIAVATTTPQRAEALRVRYALLHVDVIPVEGDEVTAVLASWCHAAYRRASAPRMVFHAPYPLDPTPASASRRRPNKMLEAFKANGYRIHRITGNPFQRRLGFADLRHAVARGAHYGFLYSENSTQPNILATSLRHGIAPLLEARILRYCDRQGIPVGQFYRDVYWRFPHSLVSSPLPRRILMHVSYRFDLWVLRRSSAHMFLPSLPMASIVPFPTARCTALPPGAPIIHSTSPRRLELLYVGSVGPGYEIDELLRALQEVEGVNLTMVVPERGWEANRQQYAPLLTPRVRVVHASSDELQPLYERASACLLMMAPDEYRQFAVPLKLYEYLGYGKPTIASEGTLAGSIVDNLGIGFTVPNERTQIIDLLQRLSSDMGWLDSVAERVRSERHHHTWSMRARAVADVLTRKSPR